MKKVIYYSDETHDDFAGTNINKKPLPEDYKYFTKNPVRKLFAFVFYHFIATPVVFIIQKIMYHEKIVGRKKLKKYRKCGYFLYGNHTRVTGDAYAPALVSFPRKAYIVADADAVSIPVINRVVEDLGAIPVPTGIRGLKNFKDAVIEHIKKRHVVVIYPEAHIWPYYTGVRPFGDVSFSYPAESDAPVFTFTTVYSKRRFINFPKTTVYIDGPFFADKSKSAKENQRYLRDLCYAQMKARAALSDYEHVKYVQKSDEKDISDEKNFELCY